MSRKELENGLDIKIEWEGNLSLGELIDICKYIDKNPSGLDFSVEIHGKDDVIRK